MNLFVCTLFLALAISLPAVAQDPIVTPQSTPPPSNAPQPQSNAAATKPAGAKGSTLIGCLSGPDGEGKYVLRSMQHRTGVQVLGPDNLRDDSGSKVKLTGSWVAGEQSQQGKEARRFQASEVEVMATQCEIPAETTPVSKNKQQKKSSGDASNPK